MLTKLFLAGRNIPSGDSFSSCSTGLLQQMDFRCTILVKIKYIEKRREKLYLTWTMYLNEVLYVVFHIWESFKTVTILFIR